VRKPGEFAAEHVDGAKSIPLDFINEDMAQFPKEEPLPAHKTLGKLHRKSAFQW
jgi:rhodanese-related sulfurtransferase